MTQYRIDEFIEQLKSDKIVKKNIYSYSWLSGCSTHVSPITVWKNEIVLQWGTDRRIFDKWIKRVVERNGDLIKSGRFWKSDGSCPSTIIFWLKEKTI